MTLRTLDPQRRGIITRVLLLAAVVTFFALFETEYRVTAPAAIEGAVLRTVAVSPAAAGDDLLDGFGTEAAPAPAATDAGGARDLDVVENDVGAQRVLDPSGFGLAHGFEGGLEALSLVAHRACAARR